MVVSASLAVALGIVVIILRRNGAFTIPTGLALSLFGFTLASTGLGPTINNLLTSLVGLIGSIRF
ncbi:hypothetical protein ACWCYY_35010 [Kitasatospora sp. NPDC001664]